MKLSRFDFCGMTLRAIVRDDDHREYFATDALACLGLKNVTEALRSLDDDEKGKVTFLYGEAECEADKALELNRSESPMNTRTYGDGRTESPMNTRTYVADSFSQIKKAPRESPLGADPDRDRTARPIHSSTPAFARKIFFCMANKKSLGRVSREGSA
jgi:hypothetical protein